MSDKLELVKAIHEAIVEIVGSSNDQATVRLALEVFRATINDEMLPVARAIDGLHSALPEAVKAETPDEIDWSEAPKDAMYMARDEDGEAHFYSDEPHFVDWDYEWIADGGACGIAYHCSSYKRGTCDWKDSLVKRPGVE